MIKLLPEQIESLQELNDVCGELKLKAVLIGAIAYRTWLDDENRTTEDLDVAVAIEIDEMPLLAGKLEARGWHQDQTREHRWYSGKAVRVDLLPAGPKARAEGKVTWPRSKMVMQLDGFELAFAHAVRTTLAPRCDFDVVPLPVLVVLKMAAFMDAPHNRSKDIQDLGAMMRMYGDDSTRRFDDVVINAGVQYDAAGAFLLGLDVSTICSSSERKLVKSFLPKLTEGGALTLFARSAVRTMDEPEEQEVMAGTLINAFEAGFNLR